MKRKCAVILVFMLLLLFGNLFAEDKYHFDVCYGSVSLFGNAIANKYFLDAYGTYQFSLSIEKSQKIDYTLSFIYENFYAHYPNDMPDKYRPPFTSIMGGVSYNYFNTESIKLYSGVQAGLMPSMLVGNINLLGLKLKGLDLFLELNAGSKAMINFGLSF